jgi:hypothetical protein
LATTTVPFKAIQANDIDAELERSLMTEWDAQFITSPNARLPFNELNSIRGMDIALDELDSLHAVAPHDATLRRYEPARAPIQPSREYIQPLPAASGRRVIHQKQGIRRRVGVTLWQPEFEGSDTWAGRRLPSHSLKVHG